MSDLCKKTLAKKIEQLRRERLEIEERLQKLENRSEQTEKFIRELGLLGVELNRVCVENFKSK